MNPHRRHRLRCIALAAMLASFAGAALARTERVQPFAGAQPPPQPPPGSLTTPDGRGPFPVVILLHGCAGIGRGAQLAPWVGRLADWGYASLIMDSFGPRGVTTVCASANQPLVTSADRAGDGLDATMFLRTRPDIDGARIAVIGFSDGGSTAVTVTQRGFAGMYPGLLRAAVDYYGSCRNAAAHGTVPLLAGDEDTWGDPPGAVPNSAETSAAISHFPRRSIRARCTASTISG
ncbi:MAG TPA: dienelactone hydrolase family protein [Acetobacteraceae bacterium]|jgi:dienelactone hydrolase